MPRSRSFMATQHRTWWWSLAPQLSGNNLSYGVKVLEGTLLAKGGACALFIDIIGMPQVHGSVRPESLRCTGDICPLLFHTKPHTPIALLPWLITRRASSM
jgi:hypothetical protein